MDFYFGNPHPYPNIHQYHAHNSVVSMTPSSPEIALSDYLMLDDYVDHQDSRSSQSTESSEKATFCDPTHGFSTGATSKNNNMQVLLPSFISLPSLQTGK